MPAFTIDASGVHETEAPADLVEKVQAQESAHRSARERREALQAQRGPRIETIQIDGEDWHIKLLDWPSYMLAGVLLGRGADGRVASRIDILRALTEVALHCGVASGPNAADKNDLQPYFSQEEAEAWAQEPGTMLLAGQLYNEVTRRNPELLPGNVPGASSMGSSTTGSSSKPARKPRASRKN